MERPFYFVETNLLSGREFRSLEHLNEVAAWWLAEVADVRVHLYKLIDARSGKRSTALGTNIDFEKWSDYLGDPPLAMAFLDRVAYRATALKICGKSYRAHRAKKPPSGPKSDPS